MNEGEEINPALESFSLQGFFIRVSWNLRRKECAHLGHSWRLDHSGRPSKGLTRTSGLDLMVRVSDFPQRGKSIIIYLVTLLKHTEHVNY